MSVLSGLLADAVVGGLAHSCVQGSSPFAATAGIATSIHNTCLFPRPVVTAAAVGNVFGVHVTDIRFCHFCIQLALAPHECKSRPARPANKQMLSYIC